MGTPLPFSTPKGLSIGSHNPITPPPSPSTSPSPSRLWKPAAQMNIRNQWSKLLSSKERWFLAASQGTSYGTNFVNTYINRRKVPAMDLRVLIDMPGIRERSCDKLDYMQICSASVAVPQEVSIILQGYEDMAHELVDMFIRELGLKKWQGQSNPKSISDKYSALEDGGSGFPIAQNGLSHSNTSLHPSAYGKRRMISG